MKKNIKILLNLLLTLNLINSYSQNKVDNIKFTKELKLLIQDLSKKNKHRFFFI